jgi:uncharacterized protein YbjT (DUF2867 family)
MKILVIGRTRHAGRLVVDELRARGVDVRLPARQRLRPGTPPIKPKTTRVQFTATASVF